MTGFIGVLMLDTAFERVIADAGNPDSYHRPARLRVVENAGSPEIVRDGLPSPELVDAFCLAAQELEAAGAVAITSTCGFLISVQDRIAAAVTVPVMVSALSLFPLIRAAHGNRPVGILTASRQQLGPKALGAAGAVPDQVRIAGLEDCPAFAQAILVRKSDQPARIDRQGIADAAVARALMLCDETPDLGAILLECGNLPPYADAITAATGKQVYSILDAARLIAP
ncbi:aspartate/glutamate racemase family protein [Yoonia sp. R2-816]|uniref:aspartate/glutamate racemase family protein n=1 Tax=Yoonia sp. R2-816 TaxID=3342638 RepID=UPI00372D342A